MTLVELLPFAAIAAAFWLLIIRPASTRRKAQAALVASLAPGQRIMTTAGVFGTVAAMDGERVSVEVAPGVVIEMLAVAIAQVVPVPAESAPSDASLPDDGGSGAASAADLTVENPASSPAHTPEADRG